MRWSGTDRPICSTPTLVDTDLAAVDRLLARARHQRTADPVAAEATYTAALGLYSGELLQEEGPAEWVVSARERWRLRVADAARDLAVLQYRQGRTDDAAASARLGLGVDRHSDPLWRVLVAALRSGDDVMAAERAEADYDALLLELAV